MTTIEEKSALENMLKAGVHFGYSKTSRNSKMKAFICSTKNGVEIFDLEKVKAKLDTAKEFLKKLGKDKKVVLFVGTKREAKDIIKNLAVELNMPYVIERWLGGALTNFREIKSRIDVLADLNQKKASGELDKYTKKERVLIDRKIAKLEKYLGGLRDCKDMPGAIVAVDSNHEKIALDEAKQMKVARIVLMNSDCEPKDADYAIPGNDNSITSINYILNELVGAYKEGIKSNGDNGTN